MLLKQETRTSLDLSAAVEVFDYTHEGDAPILVAARVDLGDADSPIAGGGKYILHVYINGNLVTPDSSVTVPSGTMQTSLQSRQLILAAGDVLTVEAVGRAGDVDVDVTSYLMDTTPAQTSDLTNSGEVLVDHNYGGSEVLSYKTQGGQGVDNATVRAYLKTDYDAGNRNSTYIKAESRTTVTGAWNRPMMLDPGVYTLLYFKQGSYGPDTKKVTVS